MAPYTHHIGLTITDLEKAVRFYTQGLGCEVAVRQTNNSAYLALTGYSGVEIAAALVRFPGDNLLIELQEYRHVEAGPSRVPGTAPVGSSHICVAVEDLTSVLELAEQYGGRRVTDPVDIDWGINKGARAVYLRDPDGHTIELFQKRRD